MLKVEGVKKKFGTYEALKNVSFEVHEGRVHGFLGPNGAGKTTMMNMIASLSDATEGTITFRDEHVQLNSNLKGKIGYLPQVPQFSAVFTALQYVTWLGKLSGLSKREATEEGKRLLFIVGLEEAMNRKIKGFSGGMRQRLGLACALIGKPQLLLLDEPLSALDPQGRTDMMHLFQLLRKEGITLFFSTHILHDIEHLCDDVTIIRDGETVLTSSMEALIERYSSNVYEVMYEHAVTIADWIHEYEYVQKSDTTWHITLQTEADVRELVKKLYSQPTIPIVFQKYRQTLEDIFQQVVSE